MYPPWNYLTLRHAQNTSWAQSQFDRGVSYAKAALHQSCENSMALIKKAEVCYKEGLEMVPHHIQILTAYGALCINDGRLEMARDLLDKAIQYATQRDMNDALAADANIVLNHEGIGKSSGGRGKGENKASSTNRTLEDAKTYLSVVEGKLRGREQMEQASKKKGQHMALSNKAEQAMNDALAERAFSVGDDPKKVSVSGAKSHGNYELLSLSEDNEQEDNESLHKRKKKDSHRKKKRRRRESKHRRRRDRSESSRRRKKRQRYDSSSSDHESGGDDSESRGSDASYTSDSRDRKRKKHRKKVSKSKRRSNTSR
jgi:hypothetical protein